MRTRTNKKSRFVVQPLPAGKILFPAKDSEFEVQSALYSKLISFGACVRGEVLASCIDYGKPRRVRFDLVVFDSDCQEPIAIIECKNTVPSSGRILGNRQQRRYSCFGVPVLGCFSMDDVDEVAAEVLLLI